MPPLARRLGWVQSSAWVDLVIALVLCAVALLEVALVGGNAASAVAAAVWALPLAVRRRAPLAPALAVLAGVALNQALGDAQEPLGVFACALVAGYSVAAYGSWWRAAPGGLALLLALELHSWWAGFGTADSTFSALLVLALAWLSGRLVRGYRDRTGQ